MKEEVLQLFEFCATQTLSIFLSGLFYNAFTRCQHDLKYGIRLSWIGLAFYENGGSFASLI